MVWEASSVLSNSTITSVKFGTAFKFLILKISLINCIECDTIEIHEQKSTRENFQTMCKHHSQALPGYCSVHCYNMQLCWN